MAVPFSYSLKNSQRLSEFCFSFRRLRQRFHVQDRRLIRKGAGMLPVVDTIMDIQNLRYDLAHRDDTSNWQLAMDYAGLLPVLGEVADIGKALRGLGRATDALDTVSDTARASNQLMDGLTDAQRAGQALAALGDNATIRPWVNEHPLGLNTEETVNQLAEIYKIGYTDSLRRNLLKTYVEDVDNGWISPLCGFENYEGLHRRVETELVGQVAANGITIRGQARHFLQRVVGTSIDPAELRISGRHVSRSGVEFEDIVDAMLNGRPRPVKTDDYGLMSQKIFGTRCILTVNPETGYLIQCNRRSVIK